MTCCRRQENSRQEPLPSLRLATRTGLAWVRAHCGLRRGFSEDQKMGPLTSTNRCVRRSGSTIVMMAILLAVSTTLGFAATQAPETIQATYVQAGKTIGVTLI